ncbi:hypothetical protein [Streptomyces sp. MMG1533]|uniref:hypothetical protein n=1 Tax=Streptomyces sp. MMG1533 TaxID=1415546 RepID=UPI000A4B7374|nr:hypothetical protein [Streptomyces sp. MMG1533]
MIPPKPAAHLPKKPARRRYISAGTEQLLRDCFAGLVPAHVIEEALRQMAIREGRLRAPRTKPGRQA